MPYARIASWSPWPPAAVLVVFASVVAAAVLAAHAAWRTARAV
jgi:hypothetical protein